MMNRALLRERKLPLATTVLVVAAAVLLALAAMAVVAVVMYRTGDIMMAAPVTFAMGDYLLSPLELTTLVPIPTDGHLPVPSM
jgi:hypothetical protein